MDIQTIVTSEIESGLSIPVLYREDAYLANLKLSLAAERYTKLPGLFSGGILDALKRELSGLQTHAKDRDFTMPGYETPRIMTTIGGQVIRSESDLLKAIYRDAGLRQLVNTLVGRPVYDCLDANEWMIATILNAPGNTHGWHLDDPPLALVIFVEAPAVDDGGLVELIRDWPRLCTEIGVDPKGDVNPIVEQCRAAGLIEQKHHSAGDAYLFRADECLHRVTPLLRPGLRRAILNLTFELVPNYERQGYTVGLLVE
jgi:hypothetical protein